jgi:glycosyltransferase involved in cell wall biosynthesis
MIAPEPFFEPRGTPISVYQRLQTLSALGHTVDLLTYHVGDEVDIPGVTIHRVLRVPFIKYVKIGPSWSKLLLDVLLVLKTIRMLFASRYEMIHSHEEAAYFCMFLAIVFDVLHLYDMHSSLPRQLISYGFWRHGIAVRLFHHLETWTLRTCDAVLTVGTDLENRIKRIDPTVPLQRVENLPLHAHSTTSRADLTRALAEDMELGARFPVVYTGTLEPYQGLDLLLESAPIVHAKRPDILFVIVGGRPDQVTDWRDKVKNLQLEECMRFMGAVPPTQALAYLDLAEVLVSPRVQGLSVPLKIYSYLWSGKPTVATKIHAHTQILSEQTAMLVAPTKEGLASGIIELAEDAALRCRIGMEAKEFATQAFDLAERRAKVDQLFKALEAPADSRRLRYPRRAM